MTKEAVVRIKEYIEKKLFNSDAVTREEDLKAEKLFKKQNILVDFYQEADGVEVAIHLGDGTGRWSTGKYVTREGRNVFHSDELYKFLDEQITC